MSISLEREWEVHLQYGFFFLLQLLLPYNLQVIFSHNAQQESAAARVIYLVEAWLVGLKNTDSTFLASGDGARRGKCHPVSLAVSSISLSQTTATLMLKQVMVTSFCVAPEKMHHPLSIPNNCLHSYRLVPWRQSS